MSHIQVGVLRGGNSQEYDLSMQMGARIINMLRQEPWNKEYRPVDILIDRQGAWHVNGLPVTPEQALRYVDVVFNALHGEYGGDGRIQHTLETFHKPFTGTKAFGTIMAKDKKITRDTLKKAGIKTPYAKDFHLHHSEPVEPIAYDLFKNFPMPVVVKPRNANASIGVSVASNVDELIKAIDHARVFSPHIVVEEYISGKEIISGFVDGLRDHDHYPFMPIEVHPQGQRPYGSFGKKSVFEYSDKLSGNYDHKVPAVLSDNEKEAIANIVRRAKSSFDMRHIGTVDIIVHPQRGVYVLEVNTHPHFHDHAPFLKSLDASGIREDEVVVHMIKRALGYK